MGLDDLQVFNEFTYLSATEVLRQQIDLFNEASNGAIVLKAANNTGDYTDTAFYALIAGLIRRRNVYASGAVAEKVLEMLLATTVKVAGGTPPVRVDPAWFSWINRAPEEAGAVYGQQLAVGMMADMLNTALLSVTAALAGTAVVINDTDIAAQADFDSLLQGARLFGDASEAIACWVMHSHVLFSIYGVALTNGSSLFNFGNVKVNQDGFGRRFVISDSPALVNTAPNPDTYNSLGLVPAAVVVEQNDDFLQNIETGNGNENITRTIQSEWTYNLGVKGYAWDKATGGHSPTDAALGSTANWDQVATSHKDLAGVLVRTQ